MALTKIDDRGLKTPIDLLDNEKIRLGTGNDLEIYHDGSHSIVSDSGTGQLRLTGSNVVLRTAAYGEVYIVCTENGSVDLYHDNNKKLETTSGGIDVTGIVQCDEFKLLDGEHAKFGTGEDLRIYHDGSHSIIKNSTGSLQVLDGSTEKFRVSGSGTQFNDDITLSNDSDKINIGAGNDLQIYHDGSHSYLQNGTGTLFVRAKTTETGIAVIPDGSVDLYYDNSKKFETESGGCTVTGGSGSSSLKLDTSDGTLRGYIYADDSNHVYLLDGQGHSLVKGIKDRAVEIYHDNTKKAYTYANGFALNGNLSLRDSDKLICGGGNDLEIYHDGSNAYIKSEITGHLNIDAQYNVYIRNQDGSETRAAFINNGSVELYHDNSKKFHTTTSGAQLTGHLFMDDDNKVQLGTSQDLQLYHDGSHSYIKDAGTGNLQILSNQVNIQGADASEYMAKFHQDSDVELYHNGSEKFATTAEGIRVTGFVKSFSDASDSDKDNTHEQNVMQQHNAGKSILVLENSADSLNYGVHIDFTDNNPDDNVRNFLYCEDSSAARAIIYSSGDVWTSDDAILSSDQTLKENIVDATPKLEDLKKLKVRNFNWKADYHPEKSKVKQLGFIAQEVEQVFPALVTEHDVAGDPLADDHVPNMKKSIRQAWAPILVKALQEAVAKIETLETKVAALEAK